MANASQLADGMSESRLRDAQFDSTQADERDGVRDLPLVCTDRHLQRVLGFGHTKFAEIKAAGLLPERISVSSSRHARYYRKHVIDWLERRGQQQPVTGRALRVVERKVR